MFNRTDKIESCHFQSYSGSGNREEPLLPTKRLTPLTIYVAAALSLLIFVTHSYAQSKKSILSAIGKPLQRVSVILGVKDTGQPSKYDFGYVWTFPFEYKGAEEGQTYMVGQDKKGKKLISWRVALYFSENIGEKKAMLLAGLKPGDWKRMNKNSYLQSKKYPKMLVKYNFKAGEFINFETSPKNEDLKWGLEIGKDPYYK